MRSVERFHAVRRQLAVGCYTLGDLLLTVDERESVVRLVRDEYRRAPAPAVSPRWSRRRQTDDTVQS